MGYASRDDDLHDYDPGDDAAGIYPVIRQAPGPGADRYAGYEWYQASPPGRYGRPGGHAGGPPPAGPASQPRAGSWAQGGLERERASRMRPHRWVIAIGSVTGAVAVYVALTTAGVPAKPMPSPFTPATTQGAPGRPASTAPVNCVTAGP